MAPMPEVSPWLVLGVIPMSVESPSSATPPEAFANEVQAGEFIDSVSDPVVRNLLKLVASQLVLYHLQANRPDGQFDLLYCYRLLNDAFSSKPAFERALTGDSDGVISETEEEWVNGFFSIEKARGE